MNRALTTERWRIAAVVAAIPILGLLTGNWFFAAVVPAALYIGWTYHQFHRLAQWLETRGKSRESPEGGGIWQLVVSRIYQRERAARRRKKRSKQVLKRFSDVVSALPDAAILLNRNYEIEWSNPQAENLLGILPARDRHQLIGNILRDPEFLRFLEAGGGAKGFEMRSPVEPVRTVSLQLTRFGKGQKLLTGHDISERAALQRMRKAFFANASHELRTPLTVITGYLDILNSADEMPGELKQPLANALQQAERMESLLGDLLTLSRLEQSTMGSDEGEETNVASMIERLATDISKTVTEGSHHVVLNLDKQLKLRAISAEVESVVGNLLKNAVKYTPDGTTIEVTWTRNGKGHACLIVSDNGEGIPAKHLPHLTERFYRVDAGRSRESGGTGLGLAIVKHIVERHGGFLNISSMEGEGTDVVACFGKERAL